MTRYLYRIEWDDVTPTKRIHKRPVIAGGVHDAREARRLGETMLGSGPWRRSRAVRGMPVIVSVRRLGLDTPVNRDNIEAGR